MTCRFTAKERSKCKRCRIVRFAIEKLQRDPDDKSDSQPSELTLCLRQIRDLKYAVKPVVESESHEKANRRIREFIAQRPRRCDSVGSSNVESPSSVSDISMEPRCNQLGNTERLWNVIQAPPFDYRVHSGLRIENLQKRIPKEDTAFWDLVCSRIQILAQFQVGTILQLIKGSEISSFDMCNLLEASYSLIFFAQTSCPGKVPIFRSHDEFDKMNFNWPENKASLFYFFK